MATEEKAPEAAVQYETRVYADKGGLWIAVSVPGTRDNPLSGLFGGLQEESCLLLAEGNTPRLTLPELQLLIEATGEVLRGQAEAKRHRRQEKPGPQSRRRSG
jgi:hypothetical protein